MSSCMFDVFILLSDRLIPKPPIDVGYLGLPIYCCSTCFPNSFLYPDENFCNYCGQAIDWDDVEMLRKLCILSIGLLSVIFVSLTVTFI